MAIVAIEHFTRNACFAVIHRILISIYGVLKQRRCLRTVILAIERTKKIRILYTYLRKCRSIFIFQYLLLDQYLIDIYYYQDLFTFTITL